MSINPVLTSWLPYHKPEMQPTGKIRVFCFPYAGGTTRIYRHWSEYAAGSIEIIPVQLPGREMRMNEAPFCRMDALIDALVYFLGAELAQGPFALLGHSMGGKIAFELARALEARQGPAPVHLFVSGTGAPQLPERGPRVHHLNDAALVDELRRMGGTPEEILSNQWVMQVLLPFIRADYTLSETWQYTPGEPLHCPITAFGGKQDPDLSWSEIDAWRTVTTQQFRTRMFNGDHFFIHAYVPEIVRELEESLLKLQTEEVQG